MRARPNNPAIISSNPTLSVIVVSYNTRDMTLDCLRVLYADLSDLSAEVIVVDNASHDGSAEAVALAFPKVRVLANPRNAGFGAANNLAMKMAAGRYFLLLNSDALLHAGCLIALVQYLEAHPEVGLVGPRLLNTDESLQRSCWRFPSPLRTWLDTFWITNILRRYPMLDDYRYWQHDYKREVDFVIGACLLVRREICERVGGFDERFFMYQEETDWQLRIKQAGWKITFIPNACATHLGGFSGKDEAAEINRVFFESLDFYIFKHFGPAGFALNRVAQITGAAMRVICWSFIMLAPARRKHAMNEWRRQVQLLHRHLKAGCLLSPSI